MDRRHLSKKLLAAVCLYFIYKVDHSLARRPTILISAWRDPGRQDRIPTRMLKHRTDLSLRFGPIVPNTRRDSRLRAFCIVRPALSVTSENSCFLPLQIAGRMPSANCNLRRTTRIPHTNVKRHQFPHNALLLSARVFSLCKKAFSTSSL